jgi:hypothetical protein
LSRFVTRFGSLEGFQKGRVEVVDDDPRHYAFSNVFEVAAGARPWEQVAVGQNRQYVLEVVRAEGTSGWRTATHDQSALVMDGQLRVELRELGPHQRPDPTAGGSRAVVGEPAGVPVGRVVAGRGHLVWLPGGVGYRLAAPAGVVGVVLLQTIQGPDTRFRWAQICQLS